MCYLTFGGLGTGLGRVAFGVVRVTLVFAEEVSVGRIVVDGILVTLDVMVASGTLLLVIRCMDVFCEGDIDLMTT